MSKSLAESYIVVVEDDLNDQLITLDLLRLGGANRCFCRKTVDSAISFAEKLPQVDLFLVDINMPERSGYELLAEVRTNEQFKSAYVVALTAGTSTREVNRARELGFDGFLSKPLKPKAFSNQVQEILAGEAIWERR